MSDNSTFKQNSKKKYVIHTFKVANKTVKCVPCGREFAKPSLYKRHTTSNEHQRIINEMKAQMETQRLTGNSGSEICQDRPSQLNRSTPTST
ncbi:unnamed protein product [Absidia cylindrospora]